MITIDGMKLRDFFLELYTLHLSLTRYVYQHHFHDADWFAKFDDDSYVVVENLRYYLEPFNSSQPLYFGRRFKPYVKQGYMSGGAGYVLSKEALRRFAEDALKVRTFLNLICNSLILEALCFTDRLKSSQVKSIIIYSSL